MTSTMQIGPQTAATKVVEAGGGPILISNNGPATVYFGDDYAIRYSDATNCVPVISGGFFTVTGETDLYACVAPGTTAQLTLLTGGLNFFSPPSLAGLGGAAVYVQAATPTGSIPPNSLWFNTTLNALEYYSSTLGMWVTQAFAGTALIEAGSIVANLIAVGTVISGIVNGTIVEGSYFISGSGGGVAWENAVPTTPGYYLYYDPGATASTPSMPATTVDITNTNNYPCQVVISGGTITQVQINDATVGTTAGTYYVPSLATINITYTVAPTWAWTQVPQLIFSVSAAAGTDQWGNSWAGGETLVGLPGILTNIFSVTDANNNRLAGIDSSGNIVGQTITGNIDVYAAGNSLTSLASNSSQGVVTRGWAPASVVSLPWPSTPVGTTEIAILELDFIVPAGRSYLVQVLPCFFIPTVTASTQQVQRLRYTNNGTTPTTSSTEITGHSPGISAIDVALSGKNFPSPYMEWIPPTPAVATTYKMLISAFIQGTGSSFQYQDLLEMRITDNGFDLGQMATNNAQIFGSGSSGGGSGAQNYSEVFYPANTWSYYSIGGQRNSNSTLYHGAYQYESGFQYSYIQWAVGSLGNDLNTVLGAGYTFNSASIRLTNLHSWYDNGMRFGLHASTSLGNDASPALINTGGTFISEGATTAYSLSASQLSAFSAAGTTYMVLMPDSTDLQNLSWYGYFYGPGNSAYMPKLTIRYTH